MNEARDNARENAASQQPQRQDEKGTAAQQSKKDNETGSHREGEYEHQDDDAGMNPGYIPDKKADDK